MFNLLKFLLKNLFNNYMDFKNYICIIKKKIFLVNFMRILILEYFLVWIYSKINFKYLDNRFVYLVLLNVYFIV